MIVPGRILVIDDVRSEVEEVIDSLRKHGESVLFAPSIPEEETFLENVRLLIIDLNLAGEDKDSSYAEVVGILEKLSEKTRFFIIAIWTKYARNTDEDLQMIEDLKNLYNDRMDGDLKAIFLEPFGKSIPQADLFDRIKKSLASHPECGLLFEIEGSIEAARDQAVSDLVDTASIPVILKTLKEQIGDVALIRHMIALFLRILGRHCIPTDVMAECVKHLVNQTLSIDVNKYGHIHSLQSYYEIPKEALVWTGDVLHKEDEKEEYAVVISPACDFAQRKRRPLDFVRVISAMRFDHDFTDEGVRKKIKAELRIDKKRTLTDCVKMLLTGKLQDRFYVLRYVKDRRAGDLYHLVLDFQRVGNLPFKETAASLEETGWTRICRIDAPIIDDLLQKYSAYSSRIGIQAIPKEIVDGTIGKIKKT